MNEVVKKINQLILDNAEVEDKNIDNLSGLKLVEDLGYDSIKLLQLIVELEEEFNISFEGVEDMIGQFEKYDSIVNLVIKLIRGK